MIKRGTLKETQSGQPLHSQSGAFLDEPHSSPHETIFRTYSRGIHGLNARQHPMPSQEPCHLVLAAPGRIGLIGLGNRMRLHIGKFTPKKGLQTVDSQLLCPINILTAAIIASPGITFCVFVGQKPILGRQEQQPRRYFQRQ